MKAICIALLLLVSARLCAQRAPDSTQTEEQPAKALPQSTTQPPQYQDDVMQDKLRRGQDVVPVRSADVPAAVRKALQHSDYKGWEESNIYFDKGKKQYLVEIYRGSKTRTFYFDEQGKRVKQQ